MAFNLKKLQKISSKTKLIVCGWIRIVERKLASKKIKIPNEVQSICILYFAAFEIFDIAGDGIEFTKNGRCITKKIEDSIYTNIYGINEIDSTGDRSIYKWDILIRNCAEEGGGITVGISSVVAPSPDRTPFLENNLGIHYLYDSIDGSKHLTSNVWDFEGDTYETGDTISICMYLNYDKIVFYKNGCTQFVYTNIRRKWDDADLRFRLVVSLITKEDCVEIVNFSAK